MAKKDIAFIIPNYNSSELLIKCIKSIIKYCDFSKQNKEIIVVDDCSNSEEYFKLSEFLLDPNQELSQEVYNSMKLLVNEENKGVGYSFNKGIKYTRAKYIIRLDSDTEFVTKDFDEKITSYLANDRKLALVTCRTTRTGQNLQKMKIPDMFFKEDKVDDYMNSLDVPELTYHETVNEALSGFCFAFKRSVVVNKDIWFDDSIKVYMEDGKFHLDLVKAGYKCAIAKRLYMWHIHHGTTDKFEESEKNKCKEIAFEKWKEYIN
jgi:GT2 family glycosyltransferase